VQVERSSRVLACLEHETRTDHATANADLFRMLDRPTPASYRRFLAAIYHFEYAFEAKLVYCSELSISFIATRLRSGLLADDLGALGIDASIFDVFADHIERPRFADAAEALGWIYAIQRNTLAHAGLHRALASRLPDTLSRASRYLTAYAATVLQRWQELGTHLEHHADAPRVVEAAREAFAQQHRWYSRRQLEVAGPACHFRGRCESLSGSLPPSRSAR
jgi:heme oxygenase